MALGNSSTDKHFDAALLGWRFCVTVGLRFRCWFMGLVELLGDRLEPIVAAFEIPLHDAEVGVAYEVRGEHEITGLSENFPRNHASQPVC